MHSIQLSFIRMTFRLLYFILNYRLDPTGFYLPGLGILVFDRVQIRSRARARRRHLAIYSEDIGAALLCTLL
ncbi:hypothetical protein Syun_029763 [Stephania yunnanensis]|uniref:Uncharacterized protein n=1 Tax=Stephania yunnanensis TaxID=152371 RepID=A0AAP0EEH9_9MAGN